MNRERRQKAENRSQESGVRSQNSALNDTASHIRIQESEVSSTTLLILTYTALLDGSPQKNPQQDRRQKFSCLEQVLNQSQIAETDLNLLTPDSWLLTPKEFIHTSEIQRRVTSGEIERYFP